MRSGLRCTVANDSFYKSKQWGRVRHQVIMRDLPKGCAICGEPFETTYNIHVDHVLNRKAHPELAYELDNLQAVHGHCHSRKTARGDLSVRLNVAGGDGFPKGSEWCD